MLAEKLGFGTLTLIYIIILASSNGKWTKLCIKTVCVKTSGLHMSVPEIWIMICVATWLHTEDVFRKQQEFTVLLNLTRRDCCVTTVKAMRHCCRFTKCESLWRNVWSESRRYGESTDTQGGLTMTTCSWSCWTDLGYMVTCTQERYVVAGKIRF